MVEGDEINGLQLGGARALREQVAVAGRVALWQLEGRLPEARSELWRYLVGINGRFGRMQSAEGGGEGAYTDALFGLRRQTTNRSVSRAQDARRAKLV